MNRKTGKFIKTVLIIIMIGFIGTVIFINKKIVKEIRTTKEIVLPQIKDKPLSSKVAFHSEKKPVSIDPFNDPLAPMRFKKINKPIYRQHDPEKEAKPTYEISTKSPVLIQ